ncbi:MAG: hypothetical protein J5846_10500 [Desulfovibrio sp.]|nr:hypothetical protein [Desulfovibrio sp.]
MPEKHAFSFQPLLFAVLGALFCFLSIQGNEVNFCTTAGCSLYHDLTIAGISMWWIGFGSFLLLACLALLAHPTLGLFIAGLMLLCDIGLLALMSVTAPCQNCLVVAICFALTFRAFRKAKALAKGKTGPAGTSWLLVLWLIGFCFNCGAVLRSELGSWPILGESQEARVHLYFSPSCPHCRDAVNYYAGSVETAFYPVKEDDDDIYRIHAMQKALASGLNIEEALKAAQNAEKWSSLLDFHPAILLLNLRLLRNKAHVFLAGSKGVPFLEYRGMPSLIAKELRQKRAAFEKHEEPQEPPSLAPSSQNLPPELAPAAEQCTGLTPCP